MVTIRSMTMKQLREVVSDYASLFPGWESIEGCAFVRPSGPVRQYVGFDKLSCGSYRPMASVRLLIRPRTSMLSQFLDIKVRQVLYRDHAVKRDRLARAMEEQFVPSIRSPLNPEEVLRLCEEEAVPNLNYCSGLAALNAYLGHRQRALEWCDRLATAYAERERAPAEWMKARAEFGRGLQAAIERGEEREFLTTDDRMDKPGA